MTIRMLTGLLLACTADPEPAGAPGSAPPDPAPAPTGSPPTGSPPGRPSDLATEQGDPIEPCINELMPDTVVSARDEDGLASDWIELHNPTGADVPLAGWSVTDDPADPRKHPLDGDLVLEAGGFLVLWADGQPERGPTHLGFALSDQGEAVALFDPEGDGSVVWFGPMGNDLAAARLTDCCTGEGCFGTTFAGTPGASNGAPDTGP